MWMCYPLHNNGEEKRKSKKGRMCENVTKTFQIHLGNMASHHHHLHLRNENGLGEEELWCGLGGKSSM